MDFLFGFIFGYCCKAVIAYLKRLGALTSKDFDKERDCFSQKGLPLLKKNAYPQNLLLNMPI